MNKPEWEDFYLKISNPRIMTKNFTYSLNMSPDRLEFLNWYAANTPFIDFGKNYFMVVGFPDGYEQAYSVGSNSIKVKRVEPIDPKVTIYPGVINPYEKKVIPGVSSRPDIGDAILAREKAAKIAQVESKRKR